MAKKTENRKPAAHLGQAAALGAPIGSNLPEAMVVAAVASQPGAVSQLSPAEESHDGAERAYGEQFARVESALGSYTLIPWTLGDEIIRLKEVFQHFWGRELPNSTIGERLNKRISGQRVGMLVNTCAYYPPELRDYALVFKSYEVARVENEKRNHPLPVAELVAIIRDTKDPVAIPDAIKEEQHVMEVRVLVTKTGDGWALEVAYLYDRKESYVPEQWIRYTQREVAKRLLLAQFIHTTEAETALDLAIAAAEKANEKGRQKKRAREEEKARSGPKNDLPF